MSAPATVDELVELICMSRVVDRDRLSGHVRELRESGNWPEEPGECAAVLVAEGWLTHFQAEHLLRGKWRNLTISGKYKVLARLGSGGMGHVYLCEHQFLRRRVALKILPSSKADNPALLERFYREGRAAAALDHPNIVRVHDIDQEGDLHFLVLEYVEGFNLHQIVTRDGPLAVLRAVEIVRQAAVGLQHAHEKGLIHRDIKPDNILVDQDGTVKILDMGLARFFHDDGDQITDEHDFGAMLGTADYIAPEQAQNSHTVDIRADIYSLGATFYFLLAGTNPFPLGTMSQKLAWQRNAEPKPIRTLRSDVPAGIVTVLGRMMAKDSDRRYQVPAEVAAALTSWMMTVIAPLPTGRLPLLKAQRISWLAGIASGFAASALAFLFFWILWGGPTPSSGTENAAARRSSSASLGASGGTSSMRALSACAPNTVDVTYRAEDTHLGGGALRCPRPPGIQAQDKNSAGFIVMNTPQASLTWEAVHVAKPGMYTLSIRYSWAEESPLPDNLSMGLRVNDMTITESLSFPRTGKCPTGWCNWKVVCIKVPLNTGTNSVKLYAVGEGHPHIDSLKVGK